MYKVNSRFGNPSLTTNDDLFSRIARVQCEAAVLSNREFLISYPNTPLLYTSGVRYENEVIGSVDELVDIPVILARGKGDCFQLVAWRVAELRQMGENANIAITRKRAKIPNSSRQLRLFHVLVRRSSGELEDPSRMLGM